MKKITIFDTSLCSSNLGDQVIMDAVEKILNSLFKSDFFIKVQTHDVIGKSSYKCIQNSDYAIVGGTNLLSSNMNSYNQWKISLLDSFFIKNVILMGVGWWQYQKAPNLYTGILYRRVLHKEYLHSVRDNYTKQQLESIGFKNVVNTACPTMWSLTEEHCADIPRRKTDSVLVTFTEYNQNKEFDFKLIEILKENYKNIYFWIQQPKDYDHMYSIYGDNAIYINPSLQALDEVLNLDIDYIGTRLHAGVRALQRKKRSLILAVDNRAIEISKDTNLPVVHRNDWEGIKNWIDSANATQIQLPWDNINQWKKQF
ncbi:polysaccharide pyruvyl transferase family protein [Anabaena sp. FACHB-1391]|uniref:polysaccharide pyruvyl transferase family protein n=1 Tax=Anabaena sp. FACHB-1391 TaxID=2692771 RepID=UPI0016807FCB|nr:polysaccharide pyruvyl transferase family protein [Anabaena sp. FACHB-1391]MBD2268992.1 polysaccharide pyruvyl transferase family protein [Anabaena sp. FACHB-1391]